MNKSVYMGVVSVGFSALVLCSVSSFASDNGANSQEDIWACDIREEKATSDAFKPCFYTGAGLSFSRLDPSGNNSWSIHSRDGDGWQVYGGYHFKPDWFAEIAYFDLGTVRAQGNDPINLAGTIRYTAPAAMLGYYLDLPDAIDAYVPELPFDVYVKLGLSALDTQSRPTSIPVEEENSTQLAGALGLEYRLHRHWKLRSELKSFDTDAYAFNVSAAYIFGKKKSVQDTCEPEPKPEPQPEPKPEPQPIVAAEPEPEPVMTAAACKLFEGSFEGLAFKSGSDELTLASKTNLQAAVKALRDYESLELAIHAYTDDVGSEQSNLALSEKRAASVKRFFVEQGIDENRLSAKGFGEGSPIADNATATGKALNRRVELKPTNNTPCAPETSDKGKG